jgi:hypothetical protein
MKLAALQHWFGSCLRQPIDENSQINPLSPSQRPIEEEANLYIAPSPFLKPYQRLEIYNQQYWWRLLSCLHEHFPLLTRLFGYEGFNQAIGFPYLVKYAPPDWNLNAIGCTLPRWVQEEYHESDKWLIQAAAESDWAYIKAFLAPNETPPSADFSRPLYLNQSITLFEYPFDFFTFRDEAVKQDAEWYVEHDFPKLNREKTFKTLVFRTANFDVAWKELSSTEFLLLKQFENGISLESLAEFLEGQHETVQQEASHHLPLWIQEWMKRPLLTPEKPPT